ncbi:arsenite methyltransferase [Enemella sp. A6]|uniref:arsenite methyltransferase n=1 Tax=Enemella sp. A6 TaxID=3440152 RepID=UPI003EB87850
MATTPSTGEQVHQAVRERYAAAARTHLTITDTGGDCCAPAAPSESSCCGGDQAAASAITRDIYDQDTEFTAALAASLGCGNPTALAELKPGEDVLDLGSGGGLDVLLSARRVSPGGTAYGLDMTDDMLTLARRNQAEAGIENATFLKGQIEDVPLSDSSVDVVISNCVINLSPDKDAVVAEAYRVLRPSGRFAVSDIVLLREVPPALTGVVALWTGCISGALLDRDYLAKLGAAGFEDASVEVTRHYTRDELIELAERLDAAQLPEGMTGDDVVDALDGAFASAFIRATKPAD